MKNPTAKKPTTKKQNSNLSPDLRNPKFTLFECPYFGFNRSDLTGVFQSLFGIHEHNAGMLNNQVEGYCIDHSKLNYKTTFRGLYVQIFDLAMEMANLDKSKHDIHIYHDVFTAGETYELFIDGIRMFGIEDLMLVVYYENNFKGGFKAYIELCRALAYCKFVGTDFGFYDGKFYTTSQSTVDSFTKDGTHMDIYCEKDSERRTDVTDKNLKLCIEEYNERPESIVVLQNDSLEYLKNTDIHFFVHLCRLDPVSGYSFLMGVKKSK